MPQSTVADQEHGAPSTGGTTRQDGHAPVLLTALAAWCALVAVAIWLGPDLLSEDARVRAPPVMGHWEWRASPAVAGPLAMAAVAVVFGVRWAQTLRWGTLVLGAGVTTTVWSVALAAVDGWHRVSFPMTGRHEHLAAVERIDDPGAFVRTFIDQHDTYPIHVQGHPPGMPLVLWAMDRLGLDGAGWATALAVAGAGLATGATLVALRSIAGEGIARRVAPFMAVAPAAVWLATSTNAFFAGVTALGVALLVAGTRPVAWVGGGTVLGCALFLSYGTVPLLVIPAGIWLYRRNVMPLLWAVPGAALVTLAFWLAGFWWFDGLDATRHAYEIGVSQYRPYEVFVPLLNPAAFALATGPAVAGGLSLMIIRRRELPAAVWLVPALALAAVLVANLSGLSKAEVERIWLPFVPWILAVTALLPRPRLWLAAQVSLAVLLQLSLHSPW